MDAPAAPSSASRGARPCPQLGAVIPGPRQGDGAEHRVDDLVPVGGEHGLVAPGRTGRAAPGARGRRTGRRPACSRQDAAARPGAPPRLPPGRHRRSPGPWPPRRRDGLARRPSPARARPGAPLFPSRPGRGVTAGFARDGRAGGADRLVHLRDLPDQVPEPLVLRDLTAGLVQLRPRSEVDRPRPPARLPRQVPLRPVARMTRRGARAVRLAALPEGLVQRPRRKSPTCPSSA